MLKDQNCPLSGSILEFFEISNNLQLYSFFSFLSRKTIIGLVKMFQIIHNCVIAGLLHLNCNSTESGPLDSTISVASILQSAISELKNISDSNQLMNAKLNSIMILSFAVRFSIGTFFQAVKPISLTFSAVLAKNESVVIMTDRPKLIVGFDRNSSTGLAAIPFQIYSDLFVSRFNPQVTVDLLKFELFSNYDYITVTQMVTKHPTYASFHIHLPIDKLNDLLGPTF